MDFLKRLQKKNRDPMIASIDLSLPMEKVIHGVVIKEQPVEAYLETMRKMGSMIVDILDAAFPSQTPAQIVASVMVMDQAGFRDIAARAMGVIPEKAISVLASIMGTSYDHLAKELSPKKLAEVCAAFWAMNDLSDFFQIVRNGLAPTFGTAKSQNGGSSDSSFKA